MNDHSPVAMVHAKIVVKRETAMIYAPVNHAWTKISETKITVKPKDYMINITGIDKASILAALYNASKPLGM